MKMNRSSLVQNREVLFPRTVNSLEDFSSLWSVRSYSAIWGQSQSLALERERTQIVNNFGPTIRTTRTRAES
jgi:hypothetical protein